MVYIDKARIRRRVGRINGVWSHLFCVPYDAPTELIDFAADLGLGAGYMQLATKTRREHFDITESKRRRAIKLGAVEVSRREAVKLMRWQPLESRYTPADSGREA
jgi:hypothetical protein